MKTLAQLDEVDWANLEHAYGPADDIPGLLRALSSADANTRDGARSDLLASLDHQGVRRGPATLEAIPYVLGLLADGRTPDRGAVLRMLAELAVGDSWWFQHDGLHPEHQTAPDHCSRPKAYSLIEGRDFNVRGFPRIGERVDLAEGSMLRRIYDATAEGIDLLVELARTDDADLRAAVAYMFAWLTPHAARTAPTLHRLVADGDVQVRASAWLGLSHATKFDPTLRTFADAKLESAWSSVADPLERRTLALAIVRREDHAFSSNVRPVLTEWLRHGVPPVIPDAAFPWQRIDTAPFIFCTTFLGTDPSERTAVRLAAEAGLPRIDDEHDAADLARWVIDLGVPNDVDAFDERTLATLAVLIDSPAAWHFQDTAGHLRNRGLPDTRDGLRAWLATRTR